MSFLALHACKSSDPEPVPTPQPSQPTPVRVVSLSPSTTEALFAIGAGSKVVGRSNQCDFPKRAARLPSIGGFADPNMEAILALAPTLVVGAQGPSGPALERGLSARGVKTFFPPAKSVNDVQALIVAMGKQVGHEAQASKVVETMKARLLKTKTWVAGRSPVETVMVFDHRPIFVAGPTGFLGELLSLAGARNAVTEGGPYPVLPLERLLTLDPDLIIDAIDPTREPDSPSILMKRPGWSALGAVKNKRVRRLRDAAALRPGPRLAEGLDELVRLVHGSVPEP